LSRRHLVEEWLKKVEIPPIEKSDANRRPPKPARRRKSAEAAANDNDAVKRFHDE
jgi:hypothetical protein